MKVSGIRGEGHGLASQAGRLPMTLARAFVVTECREKRLLLGVGMQSEGALGGEPHDKSPWKS